MVKKNLFNFSSQLPSCARELRSRAALESCARELRSRAVLKSCLLTILMEICHYRIWKFFDLSKNQKYCI